MDIYSDGEFFMAKKTRAPFLPPSTRLSFSLVEITQLVPLSLSTLRRAVKNGSLKVHHAGARIIVNRSDLEAYLDGLPLGFNNRDKGKKR